MVVNASQDIATKKKHKESTLLV